MVMAFVRAYDTLLEGWEYLCLGGVADDPADRGYYQEVCEAARGYPVRLVANPPGNVVKDAYEHAAVFWHAAGYGEDELVHPEFTEHFGMSTVEAMAAGCVPVVIRKGGQPEIVEHGSSGFLWDTTDALVGYTQQLASEPHTREVMAQAAQGPLPDVYQSRRLQGADASRPRSKFVSAGRTVPWCTLERRCT